MQNALRGKTNLLVTLRDRGNDAKLLTRPREGFGSVGAIKHYNAQAQVMRETW